MLVNANQVESYFSNPENVHKLFVYEVVDFNNNIESIISENTNNFLKIKYFGMRKGIYESCAFSPQVKVMGINNDVGIKLNTDLVFISNDDFSFLERTKKLFVFTINKQYSENDDVYIITDNSIKAMNELSDDDLDKIKLDDATNLINLYSIGLQNIKKLEVGKNSTVNFKLVDELPDFSSGKNKIKSIVYTLPINSLIQAIQIVGTVHNENINDKKLDIVNEQINIDLIDDSIGYIPLYVRLKNTNPKAVFEILNFSLSRQLPLTMLKNVIFGGDFDAIFRQIDGCDMSIANSLVDLIKKLIMYTWLFLNDFYIFNKQDSKFVNYYNATYANKKAIDYNTNLISRYEMEHPDVVDTIYYSVFKAICFNLSHIMITPFGVEADKLSDEHKEILWFYIDTSINESIVKECFNTDGSFKKVMAFGLMVKSKYYAFNNDNSNNTIHISHNFIKFNDIKNTNYLPKTTINKIEDEWYQCWLFFKDKSSANNILLDYYVSNWVVKSKTVSKDNVYQVEGSGSYPTDDELIKMLPPDARNIRKIGNTEHSISQGERLPVTCPARPDTIDYYWSVKDYTKTTTNGICTYYLEHYNGPHGPGGGGSTSTKTQTYEVPIKTTTIYRSKATFEYETKYNFTENIVNWSASQLTNFLLLKNEFKASEIEVAFGIDKAMEQSGWKIINLKEDYCFSFMNSPIKMKIIYTDENNNEHSFIYEINQSFQQIDNCNALTRNKY